MSSWSCRRSGYSVAFVLVLVLMRAAPAALLAVPSLVLALPAPSTTRVLVLLLLATPCVMSARALPNALGATAPVCAMSAPSLVPLLAVEVCIRVLLARMTGVLVLAMLPIAVLLSTVLRVVVAVSAAPVTAPAVPTPARMSLVVPFSVPALLCLRPGVPTMPIDVFVPLVPRYTTVVQEGGGTRIVMRPTERPGTEGWYTTTFLGTTLVDTGTPSSTTRATTPMVTMAISITAWDLMRCFGIGLTDLIGPFVRKGGGPRWELDTRGAVDTSCWRETRSSCSHRVAAAVAP